MAALCTLAEQCEVLEEALLGNLGVDERRRADSRLKALRVLFGRPLASERDDACKEDDSAAAVALPVLHAVLFYVVKREQSWSSWF